MYLHSAGKAALSILEGFLDREASRPTPSFLREYLKKGNTRAMRLSNEHPGFCLLIDLLSAHPTGAHPQSHRPC